MRHWHDFHRENVLTINGVYLRRHLTLHESPFNNATSCLPQLPRLVLTRCSGIRKNSPRKIGILANPNTINLMLPITLTLTLRQSYR